MCRVSRLTRALSCPMCSAVLSASDPALVVWLLEQVDANVLFSTSPLPLSQTLLLCLAQQLATGIPANETKLRLVRRGACACATRDRVVVAKCGRCKAEHSAATVRRALEPARFSHPVITFFLLARGATRARRVCSARSGFSMRSCRWIHGTRPILCGFANTGLTPRVFVVS